MMTLPSDYRTWAEIDMNALLHNYRVATSTGKKVCCVIKANAYGHGSVECGRFLEKNGADMFAVACLQEAIELREGGITLPILILGYTPASLSAELARNDITQAIVDEEHADDIAAHAVKAGVRVKCHIKLDTGMTRVGLFAQGAEYAQKAARAAERIMKLPGINVTGMFTHFSVADTPSEDAYTAFQLENYKTVMNALDAKGLRPQICHTSNSACILGHEETRIDMVREGIILYGMYPDSVYQPNGPLMPVMTLKSRVAAVRELPAGVTVSYGRAFSADKPITTAVIPVGYADGYPRHMSAKGYVVINGHKCQQIGRVCMDMMMVDVTGLDVKRGDEVILLGPGGIQFDEAAVMTGTIGYELTCLITKRVPRVYKY